jgi:hypothetical protein
MTGTVSLLCLRPNFIDYYVNGILNGYCTYLYLCAIINSRELSGSRLVRCYGNLYSQARVEALEKLDTLPQLVDATELKSKILFSVVVVSTITMLYNRTLRRWFWRTLSPSGSNSCFVFSWRLGRRRPCWTRRKSKWNDCCSIQRRPDPRTSSSKLPSART